MNYREDSLLVLATGVLTILYMLCVVASLMLRQWREQRRIRQQSSEMRRDFERTAQQKVEENNRRFRKGLAESEDPDDDGTIKVYDSAGNLRIRMGVYSGQSASFFGASAPVMPPLQHDKPFARTSSNCVNCGAPVKAPVCAHCGTEHETTH